MLQKFLENISDSSHYYSFMNQCFRGFGYYAYHSKALAKLSPENRDLFLSTYQESLGLSELNMSEQIDSYKNARAATLASLPGIPFDQNPARLQALSESFHTLDLAIQNIGARYHPDNLTGYINEECQKAIGSIRHSDGTETKGAIFQQYEEDIALIEATVTDPIQKKNALATLASAHEAQIKALKEGFQKNTSSLHKAVEQERLRVSTFAVLRHESQEMKKAFDLAHLKGNTGSSTISLGGAGGVFKDLDFDSLVGYVGNNFKTLTGRDLSVVQTGDNPKTHQFSLKLPNVSTFHKSTEDLFSLRSPFRSWGYYSDPSNRPMQDMLVMATLLKLSGEEKPYAQITGFKKNPDMAMKLAQDAFAALRMAGYPEDKIKIIVNGKTYRASEKENNFDALFSTNPARRQEVEQYISMHQKKEQPGSADGMREEIEKERKKFESPSPTSSTGAPSLSSSSTTTPGGGGGSTSS